MSEVIKFPPRSDIKPVLTPSQDKHLNWLARGLEAALLSNATDETFCVMLTRADVITLIGKLDEVNGKGSK
jgi:hypothetical protein